MCASPACRWGASRRRSPTRRRGSPTPRSRSMLAMPRSPGTRGRSCARRRFSARPTWTCRRAAVVGPRSPTVAGWREARWPRPSSSTRSCAPSTRSRARASPSGSTSPGQAALGNAEGLNDALGLLTPFAEETDDVLEVLRVQSGATRRFIRDTGVVFDALSARKGQLRDLIRNSNRVWSTVAARDEQLADTFRVLPTFLREGRTTTRRLTRFAENTDPLITQLRPAARQLSPLLVDLDGLAPDLKGLFDDLGPYVPRRAQGTAGHRAGARQHQAPARPARSVPAPAHPGRRLPRALQARDSGLPRQRLGRDPGPGGTAGRHRRTRSTTCVPRARSTRR